MFAQKTASQHVARAVSGPARIALCRPFATINGNTLPVEKILPALDMTQGRGQNSNSAMGPPGRSSNSGKVITIFGATGFLGRYVVDALGRSGSSLIVSTRDDDMSWRHLKPLCDLGKIVPAYVRLDDEDAIRDCVRNSNVVINLVGKHYETKHFLPTIINSSFRENNVNIAERIARISREEYVDQLIHVSALSANPDSEAEFSRTKFEGEQVVREQFPGAVIIRPASVYGTEDRLLNWFARFIKYSRVFPLIDGCKAKVLPVYVGDVATAIAKCAINYSTANKTYELVGDQEWTRKEILELVMTTTKKNRHTVEVPKNIGMWFAYAIEQLPSPVLTRDWLKLMCEDEVVSSPALPGLRELEIEPTDFKKKSFAFLYQYQQGGHFAEDEALKQT